MHPLLTGFLEELRTVASSDATVEDSFESLGVRFVGDREDLNRLVETLSPHAGGSFGLFALSQVGWLQRVLCIRSLVA